MRMPTFPYSSFDSPETLSRCLRHSEPGLFEEHDWVTRYSSIRSLERYVQDYMEGKAAGDEDDIEVDDESEGE